MIDEIKKDIFLNSEEVCGNTMIDADFAEDSCNKAYNIAIDDFVANCKNETIGHFGCRFVDIRNVMEIAERLRINIE